MFRCRCVESGELSSADGPVLSVGAYSTVVEVVADVGEIRRLLVAARTPLWWRQLFVFVPTASALFERRSGSE